MSNVEQLPDSMQRAWRSFERELRVFLQEHLSATELDYVMGILKPVYLTYAQPKVFDQSSPEAIVNSLNEWVHGQMSGLLMHLVKAELELYRLRGPSPA